jgi:hypothetical protein
MSRSSAFFINGGAGRVICSIPAFEKYEQEHPEDDFIIICEGGMDFFKGHPTLHTRAYDVGHKGLFEHYVKDRNCITPEPYRVWEYYNQKCSLAQAFDIEINKVGVRELSNPKIYINKMEMVQGANVVEEIKKVTGFDKVIVIQPFGRSVEKVGDFIIDNSSRSFQLNNVTEIIDTLKKEYGVIVMSEIPLQLNDQDGGKYPVAQPQIPNLRGWAGVIQVADHFLGCDSVGQHIVKGLGKTATIITGSTYPVNISYPSDPDFDIIDVGAGKRVYSPIRIAMDEERDRLNDEAMEMNEKQIKEVLDSIRKRLGKSKRTASTPAPTQSNTGKPSLIPGTSPLPTYTTGK